MAQTVRWHRRIRGAAVIFLTGAAWALANHWRRTAVSRKSCGHQNGPRRGHLERRGNLKTRTHWQQTLQHQKLDAIGRLAGGIAHGFNNLVTAVQGTAESLRDTLGLEDPRRHEVQEIIDSISRAGHFTRQILAFSSRQAATPVLLDLNWLVRDHEALWRRLLGTKISLELRLNPDTGKIMADPLQLEEVIVNVLINAREAMLHGGGVTVETCPASMTAEEAQRRPGACPGRFAVLTIADTGCGMDIETRARAFEPFFSTKGRYGAGLGLATVYGITKQNGGYVDAESEVGRGSTFHIYWPRVETPARALPLEALPPQRNPATEGSETVLVVEDEALVRRVIARALARRGYTVLEAADGEQALRLCRTERSAIKLLITDIIMPGLNGREVAEHAVAMHPEMAVLYTSGYTADIISSRGLLEAGTAFIEKSFTAEALARKVREVLDQKNRLTAAPARS